MLENNINLNVDPAADLTIVVEPYLRHEEYLNRSVYLGPGHTLQSKNTLSFYRTKPTASGEFLGVNKTAVKFSEDTSVPAAGGASSLTKPKIIDISFSFPVGTTPAEVLGMRQRAIALLQDQTVMDQLNLLQSI